MFSPQWRASAEEIEKTMRLGRKMSGEYGYIRFLGSETTKLGVIVPKKVDKRSSQRNLQKRRLRVIMSELAQKTNPPYIVVYYATKLASFAILQQELSNLWPKSS